MMKSFLNYLIILFFTYIALSCKKETDNDLHNQTQYYASDTIFPSSYFPTYPQSYWKYVNTEGDTITHLASSKYVLLPNLDPFFPSSDSINHYVTKYNNHFVMKYSLSTGASDYHSSKWKTIFDENKNSGQQFPMYQEYNISHFGGVVEKKDTAIFVNSVYFDSVTIVKEMRGPSGYEILIRKVYYAKNVGIIKFEYYPNTHPNIDSIVNVENLIEYYINK